MLSSRNNKGILSEQSILIIAEKTDRIREFEIKKIASFQSINQEQYDLIIEQYGDTTSSSKEAKIGAILRYLNDEAS